MNAEERTRLHEFVGAAPRLDLSEVRRTVEVIGPPGSGKSTAIESITNTRPLLRHIADDSILDDGSRLNGYLRRLVDHSDTSYALNLQIEMLAARHRQSVDAPDRSIIDESIYSVFAFALAYYRLGWLRGDDFSTFAAAYAVFIRARGSPVSVVHMTASTEELMKRLTVRNRAVEQGYTHDYINLLRRCFGEAAHEVGRHLHTLTIDTTDKTAAETAVLLDKHVISVLDVT